MYREEITALSTGAEAKVRLLKENLCGYIIMSLLGGIYRSSKSRQGKIDIIANERGVRFKSSLLSY